MLCRTSSARMSVSVSVCNIKIEDQKNMFFLLSVTKNYYPLQHDGKWSENGARKNSSAEKKDFVCSQEISRWDNKLPVKRE